MFDQKLGLCSSHIDREDVPEIMLLLTSLTGTSQSIGHFWPGFADSFGALLVGCLVVVARGLYLARHLFLIDGYIFQFLLLALKGVVDANNDFTVKL